MNVYYNKDHEKTYFDYQDRFGVGTYSKNRVLVMENSSISGNFIDVIVNDIISVGCIVRSSSCCDSRYIVRDVSFEDSGYVTLSLKKLCNDKPNDIDIRNIRKRSRLIIVGYAYDSFTNR